MQGSLRGNGGPRYRHVADESAPYETITVDKVTPIIGAEIGGIDLSQPLSNRQHDELHRALAENLVIFFRDQNLTQVQQGLASGSWRRNVHAVHTFRRDELICWLTRVVHEVTIRVRRVSGRAIYPLREDPWEQRS